MRDTFNIAEQSVSLLRLTALEWPKEIPVDRFFSLMIVGDCTSYSDQQISDFFRDAMRSGMRLMAAWGPDCERVHDICDVIEVQDDLGPKAYAGPFHNDVIMTTWHAEDSLAEALWYFCFEAFPTRGFESAAAAKFIVVLGADELLIEVGAYLRNPESLNEEEKT